MQRDTLVAILTRAQGMRLEGDRYRLQNDYEVTVYLGQPGRAVAIDHVQSLVLTDTHVEVEARDRGTFYVAFDILHALLESRRKERRGGAGSVGF